MMNRPTPISDLPAPRVLLPAAPIPAHTEIRDAALATIEAEQWLHSNGWRQPVQELASPKADVFLAGYAKLRARIDALEREHERHEGAAIELANELGGERVMWRRIAIGALAAAVIAVGIMTGLAVTLTL